jgi:predicted NACHT family NTPase
VDDGVSWIQKPLGTTFSNEVKPEKFIEYIRDISGLLVECEEKRYQFAHLSFQEYLAAYQINKSKKENY